MSNFLTYVGQCRKNKNACRYFPFKMEIAFLSSIERKYIFLQVILSSLLNKANKKFCTPSSFETSDIRSGSYQKSGGCSLLSYYTPRNLNVFIYLATVPFPKWQYVNACDLPALGMGRFRALYSKWNVLDIKLLCIWKNQGSPGNDLNAIRQFLISLDTSMIPRPH